MASFPNIVSFVIYHLFAKLAGDRSVGISVIGHFFELTSLGSVLTGPRADIPSTDIDIRATTIARNRWLQ